MVKGTVMSADKVLCIGQNLSVMIATEERAYPSRIEDIQDSYVEVAMPIDEKGVPILPEPGTTVFCKISGQGCCYGFTAVYQDKGRDPIPVWFISRPKLVEKFQSREFVRVRAALPLILRPVNEEGGLDPMVFSETVDISGGGVCFTMEKILPVGSSVAIEINNIPNIGVMKLMCKVVRCAPVPNMGGKQFHIGTKFVDITRPVQNKLVRYIFELQRKGLAKGLG